MRLIATFTLVFTVSTLAAADRWWEIRLAGEPTGYFHATDVPLDGGKTRTTEELLFALNRLGSRVEIKSTTSTVEDSAGRFLSLESEMSSSAQTVVLEAARKGGEIEIRTRTGDKWYTRTIPVTGDLYGPEGVERLARERLKSPDERVTFQSFAAESGKVTTITRRLLSFETMDGQTALKVEEQSDAAPDKPVSWYSRAGQLLRSERDLPFGKMTMVAANRDTALRAAKGSELGSESYTRTMALSNVRLPDPRSIEHIRLKLTHRKPELGWPSFEGPEQRVVTKTADVVVLDIGGEPRPAPADTSAYLKPNAILQSDDAEVKRLSGEVVHGERDQFQAARKLQDWVAANMHLDLGVALAPASEAARNRGGTCIAFSVLLASMERAAGIPSRVAMGYAYVEGIWAGHAWTEIAVGGRWIPLDAALYRPGPADAARFQTGSYTMEDNMAAANAAGLQLYGNIDVAVLEYTIGGHTVKVAETAAPFEIAGDRYSNRWLGIEIAKPAGWKFTRLDAVYPDATIVRMENGGDSVTVSQEHERPGHNGSEPGVDARLGGHPAKLIDEGAKVRLVSHQGESIWVVSAEGTHARQRLEQAAATWKWLPQE